jgi:hypothetical protein
VQCAPRPPRTCLNTPTRGPGQSVKRAESHTQIRAHNRRRQLGLHLRFGSCAN